MRKISARACVATTLALAAVLGVAPVAGARTAGGVRVPPGWRVASARTLAAGVSHVVLSHRGWRVSVARLAPGAPAALRIVLARGRLGGPPPRTERTSRMCQRVGCLAAVNGDFFGPSGVPVGGVVANGEPVRSARRGRAQLLWSSGRSAALGRLSLAVSVEALYPRRVTAAGVRTGVEMEPERRRIAAGAVNVGRRDGIVLYTPRFGPRTPRGRAAELVARVLSPASPVRVGRKALVRIVGFRERGRSTPIPRDGIVLGANGAAARTLRALWTDVRARRARAEVIVRVDASGGATESVAGNPVLVRNGRVAVRPGRGPAARSRTARTFVAVTAGGDLLLVVVEGRRGRGGGMTLAEAARMARALGAIRALNLDGGGSSTFVVRGRVANRPGRGVERGVAVALAIVPSRR